MRSRRALALATLGVAAAHGWLLFGLAPAPIEPDEAPPRAAAAMLSVRSVRLAVPTLSEPAAPPAVAAPKPRPPARRSAPAAVASAPVEPPPLPLAEAATAPAVETVALVGSATSDATETSELPVYATRLPAAATWHYTLDRGAASGSATLAWQPTPDGHYRLALEGRIAGLTVLDWVSAGALDAHGLAPERFAIRRRGRDAQAANFQRDAGIVTFSGPTHEIALRPGLQDRLSWLVQLPAIVDAQPGQFGPGARAVVMVIGARGGADLWGFSVVGHDAVGTTPALKLVREARRPRETQVELWLDPARGHLPLRARLSQPEGGAPLELRLDESTGP